MRASTAKELPGRCKQCWLRVDFCICVCIPKVATATEIIFVRHVREAQKSTGTARIASFALPNSRVVDFSDDASLPNEELAAMSEGYVLFPAEPHADWPAAPVSRLIVLDGTWRQTRKMFKKLPAIHGWPRLALPGIPEPKLRLRDTSFESGRSTLEATADALKLLEGDAISNPLHALHDEYIERVFKARGVWEQKQQLFEAKQPRSRFEEP